MQFDQDTIKELSVYAVQQFVSNKVPLDVSIAEKAKAFQLNEDQVHRVIESTNTIAFLKLRDGASDKTFEFEVASFPGVMSAIRCSASDCTEPEEPEDDVWDMQKAASFEVVASVPVEQSHKALARALYQTRAELEKVAQEHYNCVSDLERLVPALVKQSDWQERLAQSAGSDFDRIMAAFGKSGFEKSASERDIVFVGKELELSRSVVELIKEAASLHSRKVELVELEKTAGLGLGSIFSAAKSVMSDPVAAIAKATTSAPAAAIGAGLKGAMKLGTSIATSKYGVMGAVGTAGSIAAYTPKLNQRTGRPNDVWDNIYGN